MGFLEVAFVFLAFIIGIYALFFLAYLIVKALEFLARIFLTEEELNKALYGDDSETKN